MRTQKILEIVLKFYQTMGSSKNALFGEATSKSLPYTPSCPPNPHFLIGILLHSACDLMIFECQWQE